MLNYQTVASKNHGCKAIYSSGSLFALNLIELNVSQDFQADFALNPIELNVSQDF